MKRSLQFLLCFLVFSIFTTNLFSTNVRAHRKKQPRPIKLGTSGGNVFDSTFAGCCSGTLGALVTNSAGALFVLSNNHVLAQVNKASIGDPIGQPGLVDVNCEPADAVANLSKFIKYRFGRTGRNKVDAAMAEIVPGQVQTDGSILEIGRPGQPVEAELGMIVKKSGRTTGTTTGKITVINFSVTIHAEASCGTGPIKVVHYVDQFVIDPLTNRPFVKAGDSGSLIVEKQQSCPPAVGLIFAGNDFGEAIGNRIQNVLSKLNVSIVGCGSPAAGTIPQPDTRTVDPKISTAMAVQARHEEELFRLPGTIGVGIGFTDSHSHEIGLVIYRQKGIASLTVIPHRIENLPVRVVNTSEFKTL